MSARLNATLKAPLQVIRVGFGRRSGVSQCNCGQRVIQLTAARIVCTQNSPG
jgi:hypothetical protein